ncbi:FMN-binding negative transcriptional regulator [Streptomyces narbonensis]|uniref:FMN-binding negative transcriptional regulator n=1 Tax=Streptomyces narbonensis TaxID=67333 RepID=UPI001671CD68|nr:FMN-binding negative transcriptional regulator [Streptomyces narbonensis]GGW11563.1 transcriptional regulator [Streptomyces narbonensis]
MFVPAAYRQPDLSWTVDMIRSNPLALLVTADPLGPGVHATHVPVILDPTAGDPTADGAAEIVLLGHMNRANPHWEAADAGEALVVFTGPHSYVSPTTYQTTPAAPTWNFTSVHVRGPVQRLGRSEPTLAVVQATVRAYEAEFGTGWDMAESVDYFRKILPGVGAFRIHARRTEAMFKLSQDQPSEIRERVRESFGSDPSGRRGEVADLMCRWRREAGPAAR